MRKDFEPNSARPKTIQSQEASRTNINSTIKYDESNIYTKNASHKVSTSAKVYSNT